MHKDKSEKQDAVKDKATKEKDAEAVANKEKDQSKTPDAPACDPALGDLTPEYIEWMRKYHKEDFEARYKGRIPEFQEKSDA